MWVRVIIRARARIDKRGSQGQFEGWSQIWADLEETDMECTKEDQGRMGPGRVSSG